MLLSLLSLSEKQSSFKHKTKRVLAFVSQWDAERYIVMPDYKISTGRKPLKWGSW